MIVTSITWTTNSYVRTAAIKALDLSDAPAWSDLHPGEVLPNGRYGHVAVMDEARHRIVIAAGRETHYQPKYEYVSEWFDDAASLGESVPIWTNAATGGSALPPRAHMPGAIDAARDRLVLFGGRHDWYPMRNDVWALSLATGAWDSLAITGTPPSPRSGGVAVFDPIGDRLIVFGGQDTSDWNRDDVWQLSFGGVPTWTQLAPAAPNGAPGPLRWTAAIYDPVRRRMVIAGGAGAATETWALALEDPPAWVRLPDLPGPRYYHAACYDSRRDRMLLFGGKRVVTASDDALNDVLALPLAGGVWEMVATTDAPPAARYGAAAVYDSLCDRMVITYGTSGYCSQYTFGDVWELRFDDATAVELAVASADATPDRVALVWYDASRELGAAMVERRTESSGWSAVANVTADGWGRVTYEDRAVIPGTRYGYRLAFTDETGARTAGEAWIDVPARFSLSVSARPNPARDVLSVAFTLPERAPARLEVIDVAGRLLAVREVGALGAGRHVLRLEEIRSLPVGVFVVRLTQGGNARSEQAVVVR